MPMHYTSSTSTVAPKKRVNLQRRQRSSSGKSRAIVTEMSELLYVTPQSRICKGKKEDLISLCQAGLVPVTYHSFYKSLRLCSDDNEGSED
ncbi:hypothetical protein PoB_000557000 [Plakobranchus ocellatus]|uniref:Uncharacterized protein n=1 Tax=Plakobranchus ocellatus TaxID=259542 RepID=A0AAV3Y8D8_9GAST|nr:hypothetical protein PoB_000557000 [Plakobranchus ocellatus]